MVAMGWKYCSATSVNTCQRKPLSTPGKANLSQHLPGNTQSTPVKQYSVKTCHTNLWRHTCQSNDLSTPAKKSVITKHSVNVCQTILKHLSNNTSIHTCQTILSQHLPNNNQSTPVKHLSKPGKQYSVNPCQTIPSQHLPNNTHSTPVKHLSQNLANTGTCETIFVKTWQTKLNQHLSNTSAKHYFNTCLTDLCQRMPNSQHLSNNTL